MYLYHVSSTSFQVHLGVALIDFIIQVPTTASNTSLSTTHVYQLETTLSEWMDQKLKASVYSKERSFLHTYYQITDESIVTMATSTNGVIKNRVVNGRLEFLYSGSQVYYFDKYWNTVIKTKEDTVLLQSLSNILTSYTPSSTPAVLSYYFSPCLNSVSQDIAVNYVTQSNKISIIRGLIATTCIVGVCLVATWMYIFCFTTFCMSWKKIFRETSVGNNVVGPKDQSKEIAPCDTFSTEGSTKVSTVKRGVLGAISLPTNYASKKRMENLSQYDMESMSMSPTSKASDSSSVTGRKPLGIKSMETLRRLMYSPRKDTRVIMPAHQDPYNMSMNGCDGEDVEFDEDVLSHRHDSSSPTVVAKQIEY